MDFAGKHARMVTEGEAILKAKHLLSVGVKKTDGSGIHVLGTCLQSSTIRNSPHEIEICFSGVEFAEWTCKCSCKAGLAKCKHAFAVLLYIFQ